MARVQRKQFWNVVGLCYYTVLLLTASIFSLYCEAEFRLHIFPIEPDTAPLPFNSSLYDSILPATRFIIKTSSPWLEGFVYLGFLKSVTVFISFLQVTEIKPRWNFSCVVQGHNPSFDSIDPASLLMHLRCAYLTCLSTIWIWRAAVSQRASHSEVTPAKKVYIYTV